MKSGDRYRQLLDVVGRYPELHHAQLAELAGLSTGGMRHAIAGRAPIGQSALDLLLIRLGLRDPRADLDRVLAKRVMPAIVDLGPHVTGWSVDAGMPRDVHGLSVLVDQLRAILREQRETIRRLERDAGV